MSYLTFSGRAAAAACRYFGVKIFLFSFSPPREQLYLAGFLLSWPERVGCDGEGDLPDLLLVPREQASDGVD